MLKIGKQGPLDDDLLALLARCHGHIRKFVTHAREAAQRADLSDEERRDLCAGVERYFGDALPLHVLDEEQSVSPRLRGASPTVDRALERMESEHHEHEALLDRLRAASAALQARPGDPDRRRSLLFAVDAFDAAIEPHLQLEETVIFPAIAALPDPTRDVIRAELRARRN